MAMLKRKIEPMVRPFKIRGVAGQPTGRVPYEVKLQLRRLRSANAKVRVDAAFRLEKLKHPAAIPELLRALRSKNTKIGVSAVRALREIGGAVVPWLIKAPKVNRPREVSILAAYALGNIKDPAAVPALLKALKGRQPIGVGLLAAEAFRRMKDPAAVPALLKALKGSDKYTRPGAAFALGIMKAEGAVPELLNALRSEDGVLVGSAAEALGRIKNSAAIPALLDALKTTNDPTTQMRIISALGDFGNAAANAAVVDNLRAVAKEHPDKSVRKAAEITLKQITGAKS